MIFLESLHVHVYSICRIFIVTCTICLMPPFLFFAQSSYSLRLLVSDPECVKVNGQAAHYYICICMHIYCGLICIEHVSFVHVHVMVLICFWFKIFSFVSGYGNEY